MEHKEYIEILKSYILQSAKKATIEYIFKKIPYLAIPVLNPVVSFIVEKIATIILYKVETAIFFTYIDIRTNFQGRTLYNAITKNKEAQAYGTDEEKQLAEKNLALAFDSFFKFGK